MSEAIGRSDSGGVSSNIGGDDRPKRDEPNLSGGQVTRLAKQILNDEENVTKKDVKEQGYQFEGVKLNDTDTRNVMKKVGKLRK
jgi:hypothetical protein